MQNTNPSMHRDIDPVSTNHWWQAADLTERSQTLYLNNQEQLLTVNAPDEIAALNPQFEYLADQGELKLTRWKKETGLGIGQRLDERLAPLDIDHTVFQYLLGESTSSLCARMDSTKPSWQLQLENIYNAEKEDRLPSNAYFQEDKPSSTSQDFLKLTAPLVRYYCHQLINDLLAINLKHHIVLQYCQLAIPALNLQFFRMINRTLLLELQVEKLQETLEGKTPEARYEHFVQSLSKASHTLTLFSEYPVLAKQLLNRARQWHATHLEFFQRLLQDSHTLSEQFNKGIKLGELTQLEANQGDRHCDGRSVFICHFNSGLKLVYKPKPLSVDLAFQQFLDWINRIGFQPKLPILNILDCGEYGWCEFIEHTNCHSEDEVKRFYQRQGAYLAIFYTLEATDFHYENIIANGELPYLIDLETLLQPMLRDSTSVGPGSRLNIATIMRSGMMPNLHHTYRDKPMVDLSGLGNSHGRPTSAAKLINIGTDNIRFKTIDTTMPAGANQPLLNNKPCIVQDYAHQVIQGFTKLYRLLLSHQSELLSTNSPLNCFKQHRIRFIIRGTDLYVRLLHASFHPDYLQNGLMRDRLLDKLWLDYHFYPAVRQLIASEQNALKRSDVPLFTSTTESCSLFDDQGNEFPDFFPCSGLAQCHLKIEKLSHADLAQQHRILRDALTGLKPSPWDKALRPERALEHIQPSLLINTAEDLAHCISIQQTYQNQCTGWIQPNLQGDSGWVLSPISINMYEGLAGMVVFYSALFHITQKPEHKDQSNTIWDTLTRRIQDNPRALETVGAYTGWGGIFYTASIRIRMGFDTPSSEQVKLWCSRLKRDLSRDKNYDWISGTAGAIMGLLRYYQQDPQAMVLNLALECGDYLLKHSHQHSGGIAWHCQSADKLELTGISHGASGIAQSLLLLSYISEEKKYQDYAEQALTFENAWYSTQHKNWLDRRKSDLPEEDRYIIAWCHGAPGIGLSRLTSLDLVPDHLSATLKQDLLQAAETTLNSNFGYNQSLCHGDLGNLELLQRASNVLGDEKYQRFAYEQLKWIIPLIKENRYRSGSQFDAESYTLMNGLGGMAYELLRFAAPEKIPSVLTLD